MTRHIALEYMYFISFDFPNYKHINYKDNGNECVIVSRGVMSSVSSSESDPRAFMAWVMDGRLLGSWCAHTSPMSSACFFC